MGDANDRIIGEGMDTLAGLSGEDVVSPRFT